jgi:hypothetical protein
MSRHGYNEDCDSEWAAICWRGAVTSATRGKRGQAFLKEMLAALDALPEKKLVSEELVTEKGAVCAIGSVMVKRGIDVSNIDPEDPERIAHVMGIAPALVQEIEYINDEAWSWNYELQRREEMTDEKRFDLVRRWIIDQIKAA